MGRTYVSDDRSALTDLILGSRVARTVSTHLLATTPYFRIHTGRVLMTGLVGKVVDESAANACSWVANPTTGTATQVVCAALDINLAVTGDSLSITGPVASAMTYGTAAGLPFMSVKGVVLNVGTLDFIAAAASGSTSWILFYIPIDEGAYVTAI